MSHHDRIADAAEQLTRYGGSVFDERLLDVLDHLVEINDDMHHARFPLLIIERCERAEQVLRKIRKAVQRQAIIDAGQDPDLPPRGYAGGTPPPGTRNRVCAADGHSDPDNSGHCIYCCAVLYEEE